MNRCSEYNGDDKPDEFNRVAFGGESSSLALTDSIATTKNTQQRFSSDCCEKTESLIHKKSPQRMPISLSKIKSKNGSYVSDSSKHEKAALREALNKAANKGDVKIANEIFHKMIENNDMPSVITMNILIKAYARGKEPQKCLYLLSAMLYMHPNGYGCICDEGTFNAAIDGQARSGDMVSAWSVLRLEYQFGFSIQNGFCIIMRNTPPKFVLEVLEQYVNSWNIKVDTKVFSASIVALLGYDRFKSCSSLENNYGNRDFGENQNNNGLHEKAPVVDLSQLKQVILFYESKKLYLDAKSCTQIMLVLNEQGKFTEAMSFFDRFLNAPNAVPDHKLLSSVIDSLMLQNPPQTENSKKLIRSMEDIYSLHADIVIYNNLLKGFCRSTPPLVDEGIDIFYFILNYPHDNSSTAKIHLHPNLQTFSIMANIFCTVGRAVEAEDIIKRMPEFGLTPTALHYNVLLKGYSRCRCRASKGKCLCRICKCSNPQRSLELLEEMESRGLQCDRDTLVSIIDSFCSAARIDQARAIVNNVLKNNKNEELRPTTFIYNRILRGISLKYSSSGPPMHGNSSCQVDEKKVRSLSKCSECQEALDEVDDILNEMRELLLSPNDSTFNTILGIYTGLGLSQRARKFFASSLCLYRTKKSTLVGYNILIKGMGTSRFDACHQEKERQALYEETNEILKEMFINEIYPDIFTLNSVVSLYVENHMMIEAEEIINRFAEECKILPKNEIGKQSIDEILGERSSIKQSKLATGSSTWKMCPNHRTFTILVNGYLSPPFESKVDAYRITQLGEKEYNIHLRSSEIDILEN